MEEIEGGREGGEYRHCVATCVVVTNYTADQTSASIKVDKEEEKVEEGELIVVVEEEGR